MDNAGQHGELLFAGPIRMAESLAAGEITSAELVDIAIARIQATQDTLNAFRVVRADAARAEAAEADRRLAAGERLPLLGVPVAIKDDMDIVGESTNFGCAGTFAPMKLDGAVAEKLRAAGAVVVGKTNTPELGQWSVTSGPAFGTARSPWNLDYTPGGSSGGSAAAVAAGLVPVAVGSDGAGSVRIPAAWSNLVGIKPQRGRVSTWPDPEAFNGITGIGPLARTVRDAAMLLDVLAGPHVGDLHTPKPPSAPFLAAAERDPGRLRIALSYRIPFSGVPVKLDPEVRSAVEKTASALRELGHEVVEADVSYGAVGVSFLPRSTAGVRAWTLRVPDRKLLDRRTIENARTGRLLGGIALKFARWLEPRLQRRIGKIFDQFDVVITPTTATPPLRANALDGLKSWATDKLIVGSCPYAWPWNVLGWPGISVPAGFTAGGLPVGAQLLGPAESEEQLISLAAQLEAKQRWFEQRPPAQLGIPGTV
jgi:amidase